MKLKHFFQRCFKGHSDADLFSLDEFLASKIVKPLTEFRNLNAGRPGYFETDEEWIAVLDKMIFAFSSYQNFRVFSCEKEDRKRIQEGFELFGKYFQNLWF